jgi:serine/threonine-protein kinase
MMKMMDDMMAMLPSITVRLTNCVARGEATFLMAAEERPLNLAWNQGLLVTPQRLLETGGSIHTKPSPQDKFEIELDHVTAIVPAGLVRQDRNGMPSHQRLEIRCYHSLFAVDAGNYLLDFVGMASRDEIKLDFDGNENRYPPGSGWSLRAQTTSGTFPFASIQDWGRGRDSGDQRARWLDEPPRLTERPAHQHVPADYQLDPQSEQGGFELSSLRAAIELISQDSGPTASSASADFSD